MISLGRRRDAREELGLGFVSEGEMEDTELEEGEACSYHNNNNNIVNNDDDYDYDSSVDPDIALSYIDEKLQDVLGHFQKDFEGGVSAENLGAKFGGYGSFLPAYQRSPVWSHPRTPQKIQHCNASRSPNMLQLEGGCHSSVSFSTASHSIRLEPPALKTSCPLNEPIKQEACVPSAHFAEELVPIDESVSRKFANLPDQKMLKVRIKVGSDNLSTRKNAAIYSGLGLDVSPSSSPDESPSGSEGMSHEHQDAFIESPAHILWKMTSFPVDGGLLVSPLSDDVLQLKEKQKFPKDSELSVPRFVPASSATVAHWSDAVKGDGTMLGEKKIRALPRNDISSESKSYNNKDSRNGLDVISQEKELDSIACEELVSNALKLPLLSSSHSGTVDTTKGLYRASNVSKGCRKDKGFSDSTKESSVPIFTQENGRINNSKSKSSGKVWEDKKANALDSDSICQRKEGHRKGEKPGDSGKIDPDSLKGGKALNHAPTDPLKQITGQTAASYEQEGMKLPYVKELSSEGKKRLKGSQSHGTAVAEALKENSRVGLSLPPKNKKSTYADNYAIKGESADLKLQKNTGKAGDRYRDFFGDMELEQEENRPSPLETSYEDRPKDPEIIEKSTHTNSMRKEGPNSKKVDKLLPSEAFPKATSGSALHYGDGLIPDVASGEDNWVCCDKCQTWRLLPLHTNPDNLPEKWLCSMLDWLPGMNRCSFSEDETTHATRLCNLNNPGGIISTVNSADVRLTEQNHQNFSTNAMPTGGRKKHGSKELPNAVYKDEDGSAQLSNSMKKSLQASMANGSLNNVKLSTVVSEPDALKLSKSSRLSGEKHKHKPREKHRLLDNCSDRGGSKRSKMKDKRDHDQDCFRASKKSRPEGLPEDWTSIHGGAIEKVCPSSSNGLATVSLGKDLPKCNDPTSSKDSKHDQKDRVQLSAKKPKDEVQVCLDNESVDMEKYDDRDVTRKRKLKESHDAQIYPGSLLNTGHHLQNSTILAREEFSENEYKKDKKARVSRSEGKEASGSKGNGRTDKKGSHRKNQKLGHDLGNTQSQRILDGLDSSKRDSGSLHLAATSSSSKVSGSHKNKANFHEAKGSPVESVSSSPMRVSKLDKLSAARKDAIKKDKSVDNGFFGLGGLRKFSDGEDDGGSDRSGTARKGKALKAVPSPDFANVHLINGGADFLGKDTPHTSNSATLVRCRVDERTNENHQNVNGSRPRKSGKSSSSRSKDKNRNINLEFENSGAKVSDCIDAQERSCEVKPTDSKNKIEEKFRIKSEENDKRCVDKKDSVDVILSDNRNRESLSNVGGPSDPDVKVRAICSHDAASTTKQSVVVNGETVSEQGKSLSLHSSGGAQNEAPTLCPHPTSGSHRGNGANSLAANASDGDGETKALKHMRKVDHPNGINHYHPNSSRNAMSNGHRARDVDAPSPVKRDSSSQAATNALKEAKSLKHMADRVKNSGSNLESTKLYFEAALKFLHGASLLETCSGENAKTGEMVQWMQVYRSTAKLCEFCAHEYEKSKDMAAAALAYKCMEVAYMRVIYSSHTCANRDRHELQKALQIIPPGESPSSSASDIDNLNHPTTSEKVPLAKGISSPQVTGSHIIAAQYRPSFLRLLSFAQDTHFAMEASRKSRMAFAAAITNLGEVQCGEGISSIKTALDFNFQDVEGLLRLVRLAIEAISR